MNTTTRSCACSCRVPGCRFASTGHLIATRKVTVTAVDGSLFERDLSMRFGLCAVHVDDVLLDFISTPAVVDVTWEPRADWSTDGGPV